MKINTKITLEIEITHALAGFDDILPLIEETLKDVPLISQQRNRFGIVKKKVVLGKD